MITWRPSDRRDVARRIPSRATSTSVWASIDVNTSIPIAGFNPNRIKVEVSSDGGNNFSPVTIADVGDATAGRGRQRRTTQRDAAPAITVSQGRLPTESGAAGRPGIPGGQVAVSWDDFGDNQIMANTISAGQITRSASARVYGIIPEGTGPPTFPIAVSIVQHRQPGYPRRHGEHRRLQRSRTWACFWSPPAAIRSRCSPTRSPYRGPRPTPASGFGGANLGVVTYTMNNIANYAMGTTFDDNATRTSSTPPPPGRMRSRGRLSATTGPRRGGFRLGETLDEFLAAQLTEGHQRHLDSSRPTTPTRPDHSSATPNFLITGR